MQSRKIFLLTIVTFMLCTYVQNAQAQTPLKIVTTIGQITDVTKIIGGAHIQVEGLMGPGVDPHLYKASESDVRKLSEADLILYNGLFLEAKMENVFKRMRNKNTVAVGESVTEGLLDSINYPGHYDPHIWFDVLKWQKVAKAIADALVLKVPEHKTTFLNNLEQYNAELKNLDEYVFSRVLELPEEQRVLVTAHDAFRYFGQRYGFEVIGLQGISTESEAGVADVQNLAQFINDRKIKAIFIESSVPERTIKAVQEAVHAKGWNVEIGGELFSDAMGDEGTFKGTYIGMVTHNIDTIVDALKGAEK